MTIAECYVKLGGDYDKILSRLKREAIISKLAVKFLDDQSFALLKSELENNNVEEAYRGAHTLKGICQNLSFNALYQTSDKIASALREGDIQKAKALFPVVEQDYNKTISALGDFKAGMQ